MEPVPTHNQFDTDSEPRLYFDALPTEVLPYIVRFVSERPGAKEWLTHYHHVDAFTVLGTKGALGVAARQFFTDMRIGESGSVLHSDKTVSTKFMLIQAPRLLSLSIDRWGTRNLDYTCMKYCLNLRELTLDEDIYCDYNYGKFGTVLEACGGSLRYLEVSVYDAHSLLGLLEYATKHCTVLEALDVRHLRSFSSIVKLVKANRKTLNVLRGGQEDMEWEEEDLQGVATQCTKLEVVEMPPRVAVPLCELLGERLRVLSVADSSWGGANLSRVLEKCRKAVVEGAVPLDATTIGACPTQLRLLTTRAMLFTSAELDMEDGVVRHTFTGMLDLEDALMEVGGENGEALMNAFFAEPKYRLKKLGIMGIEEARILRKIANATVAIEEFNCSTRVPLSGDDCAALLWFNEDLKSIRIELENCGDIEESEIVMRTSALVRSLQQSKNLSHFCITNHNSTTSYMRDRSAIIEDACVGLRRREITVDIGGVPYLPVYKKIPRTATLYV